MNKILSFDVGTTSMKCILYASDFTEEYSTSVEYSLDTNGNAVRADANVYFDVFLKCVKTILSEHSSASEISSVVFTTQGETFIPVDKFGNALSKAVVWLDSSAEKEADYIKCNINAEEFYSVTGLYGIDGALPTAKLLYIKKNEPELYNKTYKFLFLEDYLIMKLTGKFVSEKSIQSSSGWYDITREKLYDKVFDICGIDKNKIPNVLPCGTTVGNITESAAQKSGLSTDTVVVTAAMDQISSAIGAGNITEGIVTETTGTALVVGASVKNADFDISNPVTVYKHYDGGFMYMPYFSTAGIVHKWFRDTVVPYTKDEAAGKNVSPYTIMEDMAKLSPPGSNGVIFNPDFTQGGAIKGLTLSSSMNDIVRSVQEGIAYVLRELIESVENKGIDVSKIYSLGGGSYSDLWCGIKASVCGKEVISTNRSETTALGAAVLASVATGLYPDVPSAIAVIDKKLKTYLPNEAEMAVYNECYKKFKE